MQNIRIWVVLAVVLADCVLVLFWPGPWNYYWLFAVVCWGVLNAYWALANLKRKPVVRGGVVWWMLWLFSLMEFLLYCLPLSSVPILGQRLAPRFAVVETLGATLCAFGVGFAIWSRHVLARSWNNVATLRDGHSLVTRGPYAIVRHPIYFGIILHTVGLILVLPEVRALVLLVDIVVSYRKIKPEEENLWPPTQRSTRSMREELSGWCRAFGSHAPNHNFQDAHENFSPEVTTMNLEKASGTTKCTK